MAGRSSGRLHDRVAIVTGGSEGIGRAICLEFAKEGALVVVADITELEPSTVAEIERLYGPGRSSFFKVDVADSDQVDALVNHAVRRWGRLDIMCNNAGIKQPTPGPIWEIDNETWAKPLSINLNGAMFGTRAAARQMLKQEANQNKDRGWIINTASAMAFAALPNACAYVTSKHAILGLTRTAALDCAPHKIHVNALCPGYVHTRITATGFADKDVLDRVNAMHPLKGVAEPSDVACVAVFLASDDARWVTGHGMVVDGGFLVR